MSDTTEQDRLESLERRMKQVETILNDILQHLDQVARMTVDEPDIPSKHLSKESNKKGTIIYLSYADMPKAEREKYLIKFTRKTPKAEVATMMKIVNLLEEKKRLTEIEIRNMLSISKIKFKYAQHALREAHLLTDETPRREDGVADRKNRVFLLLTEERNGGQNVQRTEK